MCRLTSMSVTSIYMVCNGRLYIIYTVWSTTRCICDDCGICAYERAVCVVGEHSTCVDLPVCLLRVYIWCVMVVCTLYTLYGALLGVYVMTVVYVHMREQYVS